MITVTLPSELSLRLSLYAKEKGWPLEPEQLFALLGMRMLYDLDIIDSSKEAIDLAGVPRLAWLALGMPVKDMREQLDDELDLWLNTLGEGREKP